jgi:hypothetical protein
VCENQGVISTRLISMSNINYMVIFGHGHHRDKSIFDLESKLDFSLPMPCQRLALDALARPSKAGTII